MWPLFTRAETAHKPDDKSFFILFFLLHRLLYLFLLHSPKLLFTPSISLSLSPSLPFTSPLLINILFFSYIDFLFLSIFSSFTLPNSSSPLRFLFPSLPPYFSPLPSLLTPLDSPFSLPLSLPPPSPLTQCVPGSRSLCCSSLDTDSLESSRLDHT